MSAPELPGGAFPFPESPLLPPETATELFLYSLTRFGMKPGLANMNELLARFEHPERELRFLHVAGTNGKGSTCLFLDSLLRAAGRRTGLFTSPHILHVGERLRVNGRSLPESRLTELVHMIEPHVRQLEATFFEALTLMALLHFREQEVDWVLWEVGLGGRLDCTNVVEPAACLLTSIGLDHTRYLGDTLEEIALDKLGIARPGRPFYCALTDEALLSLARTEAASVGFPLRVLSDAAPWSFSDERLRVRGPIDVDLHLPGLQPVQAGNAALALACLAELQAGAAGMNEPVGHAGTASRDEVAGNPGAVSGVSGSAGDLNADSAPLSAAHDSAGPGSGEKLLPADTMAIEAALQSTRLAARFHLLRREPALVLDGAHNPPALAETLVAWDRLLADTGASPAANPAANEDPPTAPESRNRPCQGGSSDEELEPVIIFGAMEDKEIRDLMELLATRPRRVVFTAAVQGRALSAASFLERPEARGQNWSSAADLFSALKLLGESRPLLVTGSFYLAAEAYHLLGADPWA